MAAKSETQHLATLDLLRLVAALAVLVFHFLFRGAAADGYLAQGYPEAAPYAIYGALGVRLFFLVSGFVIAWSADGRDWHSFAVARFVRLYPGFVVCMTLTFAAMLAANSPVFPVTIAQYLANLTMLSPGLGQPFMDGAYWSIVVEIIFYGWVAFALMTGAFQRFKLELVAVWLALSVINQFWLESGAVRILFITEYASFFATGILAQHIMVKGRSHEALMLFAAAFVISCATVVEAQQTMITDYGVSLPFAGAVLGTIAIHMMLLAAIVWRKAVKPSAFVLALGGLTYPLYLLHQHIGYMAIDTLTPSMGKWTAAATVTCALLAVSLAIWRFVERPLQKALRPLLTSWVDQVIAMLARLPIPARQPAKQ